METKQNFDAILALDYNPTVGQCAYGVIYHDKKKRFENGKNVRTSKVQEIDGNILKTMNTIYFVVYDIKSNNQG